MSPGFEEWRNGLADELGDAGGGELITDLPRQLLADGFEHITSATVGCFLRGERYIGDDRAFDGFDDFQKVDLVGGASEAVTPAATQAAVDDVVTGEGL